MRVRENSEQIALLHGRTRGSATGCSTAFGRIVGNWLAIMQRTKQLTFLTAGYTQVSAVFPFIVISPAYFAGTVQLGGLMQTASAFNSVQTALSFFVNAYRQLAEWRAVMSSARRLQYAVEKAQVAAIAAPAIEVASQRGAAAHCDRRSCSCGCPKVIRWSSAHDIAVSKAETVLVTGPSGSGKSTLFRAHRRYLAVRQRHHHRAAGTTRS